MGVREVAHYLRVRPSTIYSMAGNRRVPFYRLGRQLRFRKFEIDQWAQGLKQPVIDVKMEASKFIRSAQRRPIIDVNRVVKKAIEDTKKKGYTVSQEKSGGIKGLETEVKHGLV